jgi:hypothetical protein
MGIKSLNFGQPFYSIKLFEQEKDIKIDKKSIVVNLGKSGVFVEKYELGYLNSSIISNVTLRNAERVLVIENYEDVNIKDAVKHIKRNWAYAFDLFNVVGLKNTPLWRSEKQRANNMSFNLWYCSPDADCGIHNEHNFKEVHTQVFGYGKMQMFHENKYTSIYNEVILAPGNTHKPFYYDNSVYPYHQYKGITECIWLAVEID